MPPSTASVEFEVAARIGTYPGDLVAECRASALYRDLDRILRGET